MSAHPTSFMLRAAAGVIALLLLLPVGGALAAPGPSNGRDPALADDVIVRRGPDGAVTMILGTPYVTGPSDAPPADIARDFVSEHRRLFDLTPRQVGQLVVEREYMTEATGSHHVTLGQELRGYRVVRRGLTFAIDADGRVVSVGGPLARGPARGGRALSAPQAVQVAAARTAGVQIRSLPPRASRNAEERFANTFADVHEPNDIIAEPVWYPRDDGSLTLSWLVDFEVDSERWMVTYLDAQSGATLEQFNRYVHDSPQGTAFTGQHPDDSPPREVVPFSGIDGSWVEDRVTSGNNVNAYRDLDDDDTVGYQPETPPSGEAGHQHFDYDWTDAWRTDADGSDESLDADIDAVITQLFYYTNALHDWAYEYGFDEPAGNFQVDNFGRGGEEGDPVLAEAQDGWNVGRRNNANFATPSDGNSPRMQMFMWAPPRPYRDGSMDGDVVAHEYGHGITHRLIGGDDGEFGYNTHLVHASLSEGWADIVSLLKWGDAVVGEYVTGDAATGIRRVAYDTSSHMYSDYNPNAGSGHPNGEVWATMVYDIRAELGLDATTWLVFTGMKNTPKEPDFLDARDGIVAADGIHNGGDNYCLLWDIFAERGLGADATFDPDSASPPTDDDTIPDECEPTADAGGPYTTDEGAAITLDATASSPGEHHSTGSLTYQWDLTGNGVFNDAFGPTPTFEEVGQDGEYEVSVFVRNEVGFSDTASTTVTVDNVLPTVTIDPDQVEVIDEGDVLVVTATYFDPGWLDTHTATIDFGTGEGPQPAGISGVDIDEGTGVSGTVSGSFTYGDRGAFDVEVAVADNHGTGTASFTVDVRNVDPTVAIDTTDADEFGGVPTFLGQAGEPLELSGNATDPGSDDLEFTWDWGDGTTTTAMYLNDPEVGPDPFPSPDVNPRDVTDTREHTWDDACLYTVVLTVEDDDGGTGDDEVLVVLVGDGDRTRSAGYWHNQYRPGGGGKDFNDEELDCYLDIVGHLSEVFDDVRDASTRELARDVLHPGGNPDMDETLDRQLLAVWLDVANGAIGLHEEVDTDGDGVGDHSLAEALEAAEAVRVDPASTDAELETQKDILELINLRDE